MYNSPNPFQPLSEVERRKLLLETIRGMSRYSGPDFGGSEDPGDIVLKAHKPPLSGTGRSKAKTERLARATKTQESADERFDEWVQEQERKDEQDKREKAKRSEWQKQREEYLQSDERKEHRKKRKVKNQQDWYDSKTEEERSQLNSTKYQKKVGRLQAADEHEREYKIALQRITRNLAYHRKQKKDLESKKKDTSHYDREIQQLLDEREKVKRERKEQLEQQQDDDE